MKGFSNPKLILFNPNTSPTNKQQHGPHHHRLLVVLAVSLFAFASLFALLTTTTTTSTTSPPNPTHTHTHTSTDPVLSDALVHYAAAAATSGGGGRMPEPDLRAVSALIRRRAPCNLLVFGLGHETLLWRALNHGGRTVVLHESEHHISGFERQHPNALEAYDVAYATRVSDLDALLRSARERAAGECRPVQNLLFSECGLAINDLPNQLYDVAWDVILVDGPSGYAPATPGRMSAIFTAAVMARSAAGRGRTDVLVHDYEREVERVCSKEFLCPENLVSADGQLAHFVLRGSGGDRAEKVGRFCNDRNGTSPTAAVAAVQ